MTAKEFVLRFLTVHKCVGCGCILEYERTETAFCEKCQLSWNTAVLESCAKCFRPARECSCMPELLSASGALCLRKVIFYQSEKVYSPQMNIIYWLKRKNSKRVTRFVVGELSAAVRDELDALSGLLGVGEVVFTNVPRSMRSRARLGFDHAESIAREAAKSLGADHERLFRSSFFTRKQKELNRAQRISNARKSIKIVGGKSVEGKYVVLFDDIVTTGASMSACVKQLMRAGARGVLCFSVASKAEKANKR